MHASTSRQHLRHINIHIGARIQSCRLASERTSSRSQLSTESNKCAVLAAHGFQLATYDTSMEEDSVRRRATSVRQMCARLCVMLSPLALLVGKWAADADKAPNDNQRNSDEVHDEYRALLADAVDCGKASQTGLVKLY